jgi:hypothetical protein
MDIHGRACAYEHAYEHAFEFQYEYVFDHSELRFSQYHRCVAARVTARLLMRMRLHMHVHT